MVTTTQDTTETRITSKPQTDGGYLTVIGDVTYTTSHKNGQWVVSNPANAGTVEYRTFNRETGHYDYIEKDATTYRRTFATQQQAAEYLNRELRNYRVFAQQAANIKAGRTVDGEEPTPPTTPAPDGATGRILACFYLVGWMSEQLRKFDSKYQPSNFRALASCVKSREIWTVPVGLWTLNPRGQRIDFAGKITPRQWAGQRVIYRGMEVSRVSVFPYLTPGAAQPTDTALIYGERVYFPLTANPDEPVLELVS